VRVQPITVVPHVTVLGGGLAGMTAARSLSRCGIDVVLVEKSEVLGGAARGLDMLLGGEPVADFLDALVDDITKSPRVSLNTATTVTGISGTAGDFTVSLSIHGDNEQVLTGALIFATGATEYVPQEYLFGEHDGVMTQRDCERKLAQGQSGIKDISSVVMIQCVGSMTSERPFCSRYCCRQALKNALHLKQLNPAVEVTIFYRELMSYGFAEKFYTAAREKGVLFVRYEPDARPRVSTSGTQLIVSASDPASGGMLEIEPDFVVLSTGLEPEDNKSLADLAGIECDADGFLQEADPKFRPVELVKDGMYVCGTAHSPRTVGETISQALAAAGRAGALVTRSRLVPGNTVSLVNATWCSGCELCIAACPYAARSKDAEQGIAVVNHALCQACGACVSVCPNKASSMQGWSDRQVLAMLDAAL
ncbi:MAG: CoB--CoM heterodisulfide reductase iron-sulfur subunit A family protein, partial [Deltaproteobacteria bacterium]|nr:CoB--CoM heterodisulfide reductase iron-sulfur subunit A family protein [Deltaproteobacteria bacterium]